jgi:hypothetical protein
MYWEFVIGCYNIFQTALLTAKHMLLLWKMFYEEQTLIDQSDNKSVFQLYTSEMSDKDSSMNYVPFIIFILFCMI